MASVELNMQAVGLGFTELYDNILRPVDVAPFGRWRAVRDSLYFATPCSSTLFIMKRFVRNLFRQFKVLIRRTLIGPIRYYIRPKPRKEEAHGY